MKKILITLSLVFCVAAVYTQNNAIFLTGGYAFADVDANEISQDDPDLKGTGWRINGVWEWSKPDAKIAWGIALGYLSVKATYDGGTEPADYSISTIPLYFAPRYFIGNGKFKGFIKLAIGFHSSTYKREVTGGSLEGNDYGFYGGGGAGIQYDISDMIFILAEYEIAYMTNDYYRNGLMQSAMGGVGIRF
jgi:hypothetical protein